MKALLLDNRDGQTHAHIQQLNSDDLPAGEVLVDVDWSSLNYKDALAITGQGKIVRQFPMVPGIDFAGVVNQSSDARFTPGQAVLLTGWGWVNTIGADWRSRPESPPIGCYRCLRDWTDAKR
ncbi:alcohol dehydrogenase catalytic domain-containing protein [Edwardsiella tarda]